MRTFIAIELPIEVKHNIARVSTLFQRKITGLPVRMVQVENIHLTLNFLGEITETDLSRLNVKLAEAGKAVHPFDLLVRGIGVFPNYNKPKVIWVGVGSESGDKGATLVNLQQIIRKSIQGIGREEKREFHPHLTIGRIGQNAVQSELHKISEVVKSITVEPLGAVHVDQFCLMRSELKPAGPVYTKIRSFQFNTQ